ncbi:hypothetical protein [Saccharothrix sp.]|uniref:deazapurine DNA modification protein DpdA family protein n=1 Tax=Saccharothrix sp. TaxID=1873460 RepID=UPI002810E2F9|nr:hypothetical protein [Saccharothrix sp.]
MPLFISYSTLSKYKHGGDHFPKGLTLWAGDSGAYSELDEHGEWTVDQDVYGGAVYRFMEDIGTPPMFFSPQDWMCEPHILAKTGLTVRDHQEYTIDSVVYLRREFPHAPWIPVLQGWTMQDYLHHLEMYRLAGFDLAAEPLVGLGSVCRRQSTSEIGAIVTMLHSRGLRLHGFGVKLKGLEKYGHMLTSADSLAWSYDARKGGIKLVECAVENAHIGPCNNCFRYAMQYRDKVLEALASPKQFSMPLEFSA